MERFYRSSRAGMFTILEVLKLEATTADRSLLNAVAFIRANRSRTADTVPDNFEGAPLDVSFAAEMWQRILHERRRPTRLVRRHLEICVFSHLAAELRSGDIAVAGSESYANLYDQLLTWEECQPLVAGYCAEAELAPGPAGFVAALRQQLTDVAARVDAEYPDNADLVIDKSGRQPSVVPLRLPRPDDLRRTAPPGLVSGLCPLQQVRPLVGVLSIGRTSANACKMNDSNRQRALGGSA